jgi:4-amino-4-deoxy-L-arabinose transferase-like glycosyltransferase
MPRSRLILGAVVALAVLAGAAVMHRLPVAMLGLVAGDASGILDYWRVWVIGAAVGLLAVRALRGRPEEARWCLFGLIALLAIVFGFISYRHAPGAAVSLVRRFGYWQILTVSGLFAWTVVESLMADVRQSLAAWRSWIGPGALILGAAAFLHVQEPHGFKIVMDEVVLQLTAMRMHFEREVSVVVRGYDLVGNFTALAGYVDKRPLFYPFLVSTLHDLTGYRLGNSLLLNVLLTPVLTGLIYLTCRRLAGAAAGVAGVLLLVSIPLVHQNATGAGFELLNMVMILATIWLGMRYAEQPDTHRLGAFLFSGILLAQTRYESALFILPVGAVLGYVWWRQRRLDFPWPVTIAPLLLIIIPLHFSVFKVSEASWQLNDIQGAEQPFGLGYFSDNVGHALNFLFATDRIQPNSFLVSALGIVGVAFFILVLVRQRREILVSRPGQAAFACFILGLIAHTALMLLYFWGKFDDPVIRRLSLPLHLLLILSFVAILPQLVPSPSRWRYVSFATLVFIVSVTSPVVAMHRYNQENFAARWNNWLYDYLAKLPAGSTALAIDRHSGIQWFSRGLSSMPVDVLFAAPEKYEFHFKNRSFQNFFVVQVLGSDFDKNTRYPTVDDEVGDGLTLETVAEVTMSPVYHMRLSRVLAVDVEKIKEWRQRRETAVHITPEIKSAIDKGNSNAVDTWFRKLP